MAEDSDEDGIWNYQMKATPWNKIKGTELKSLQKEEKDNDEMNIIVIDSGEEDAFSDTCQKTNKQLTETWKFLSAKALGKYKEGNSQTVNSMRKGKKKCPASSNGKGKEKSRKMKSSNKAAKVTCDESSNDMISCSPNSLKYYYSPGKQANGKRKTPEPEVFQCKEDDSSDNALKHNSQKQRRLDFENDCHASSSSPEVSASSSQSRDSGLVDDVVGGPVVDVIVLEEKSHHSDSDTGDKNTVDREGPDQLPGGFFEDGEDDLFEKNDNYDEHSDNDRVNVTGNSSVDKNCQFSTSASGQQSDIKTDVENKNDCNPMPYAVAINSTPDFVNTEGVADISKTLLSSKAQKQTSLFSFFKARPSSSSTSEKCNSVDASDVDPVKSIYGNITSRPSLQSFSSAPNSSLKQNKTPLIKAASDISQITTQPQEDWNRNMTRGTRQCPFYKKIPGTSITVDAFRYGVIPGCQAYFLTHFHYDHYGGLTKKFSQPIYCSQVTGNLVESRLGVDMKWINCLPMWKPCQVADATLTLMEANHCPGAVIVLFETSDGKKILHTGDFRACSEMESYPMLKGIRVDELYLDTTYCNPSYSFPSQKEVIDFVVFVVEKHLEAHPKTLIVSGAYTIGKEKIFLAIAKALNSKICVMGDKKKVLDCLEDPDLKSRVTLNWSEGQVHVLPMKRLNQKSLFEHHARHSHFTSILAFEPTGWTHSSKSIGLNNLRPKWSSNGVTLYGVPYSEHSSFLELKRFVQFFRPKRILPTVNNGNPASRKKMEAIFQAWENEKQDGGADGSSSSYHQPKMDMWMK